MQIDLDNIVLEEENSFSTSQGIKAALSSVLTLGFLTYGTAIAGQQAKKNVHHPQGQISTRQEIKKETIPQLRVNFYDRDSNLYKTEDVRSVNGVLQPPLVCKEGDTLEFVDGRVKDKNVPVVVNGIEMDLLIRKQMANGQPGEYLTNPQPMSDQGKGERAIPATFNTQAMGLKPGEYDYFTALEGKGKIIIASARGGLTVEPVVPVYSSRINVPPPKTNPPGTGRPTVTGTTSTETKKKPKCKGATSFTIEGMYTGNNSAGAAISVDARVSEYLAIGLGVGATVPVRKSEIETLIQNDEYYVECLHLIGKTTLKTGKEFENQELFAELILGKQGKVNLGIKGGVSRNTYRGSNKFVQTVENADTKEILDQYICNGNDYKVTKFGWLAGGGFIISLGYKIALSVRGEVLGNLPTEVNVPYNNGNSSVPISMGKRWTWNASMGVRFTF